MELSILFFFIRWQLEGKKYEVVLKSISNY